MERKKHDLALKTATIYGLAGSLWIVLSDTYISHIADDPASLTLLQTYKGWTFVIVTTIILYFGLRRSLFNLKRESEKRKLAESELKNINIRLEERVRKRTEQIEESNREMESFISSVSHELRAPLRSIKSFIDILEEEAGEKLATEERRIMNIIKSNASQMQTLIDDLHRLSYVNNSKIQPELIKMRELVKAIVHELTIVPDKTHIKLNIGEIPDVAGDGNLIKQVWVNLITNAIKFSEPVEVPEITIEGHIESDMAVYSVTDNGVGFNPVYSDKLFKVFNRLHSKADFEGTGVGLSGVKKIIQRHGGRVWANGKEDSGATFYFAIPVESIL